MMILYAGGCKRVEMKEIYLEKIFDNIFVAIQSLVNGVDLLGIEVAAELQVCDFVSVAYLLSHS
jgi:hypothetical protein